MGSELLFKRWVRNQGFWTEAIEPARGGGVGVPDLVALIGGRVIFLELKVGSLLGNLDLKVSEIRPAQYAWLQEFRRAGGIAAIVVGVKRKAGGWRAFVLRELSQDGFLEVARSKCIKAKDYMEWDLSDYSIGALHNIALWTSPEKP